MPVVGISIDRLGRLLRRDVSKDRLIGVLEHLGCDIEGFATLKRFQCKKCGFVIEKTETEADPKSCDNCGAEFPEGSMLLDLLEPVDVIRLELLAVRPDMFDVGGLARAIRAYLGIQPGLAQYPLGRSTFRVEVKPGLDTEGCLRPAIACAVIRDVIFDNDLLKEVMRLQENLHWALGRDRKRASIGIYDLSGLSSNIVYRPVGPEELEFVPLGWSETATPKEILERHQKGMAFAHLLKGYTSYPLLMDDRGQVLSMPPIINSEETKISLQTRDLFIDVTGPRMDTVEKTLNVVVTSIIEAFEGARGERVEILFSNGERRITPDLAPQEMILDLEASKKLLGIDFFEPSAEELVRRMGHGVEFAGGSRIKVKIPAYRADFLHQRDLMEELAIAYGYEHIPRTMVPTMTVGISSEESELALAARKILVGLGCLEIISLILGNEDNDYAMFGLVIPPEAALIENPISIEQTLLRTWLLPGLMGTLARNTSRELPQHIFEVGDVVMVDDKAETGARDEKKAGVALAGPGIGFADIRSIMEALVHELGAKLIVKAVSKPYFLDGRGAEILDAEGNTVGEMGEIHPRVLDNLKLSHPVVAGELFLSWVRE